MLTWDKQTKEKTDAVPRTCAGSADFLWHDLLAEKPKPLQVILNMGLKASLWITDFKSEK